MVNKLVNRVDNKKIYEYIIKKINQEGALHFSLIDPDPIRQSPETAARMALLAEKAGSDGILIGGSTVFDQRFVDDTILAIKNSVSMPVIIFPGGISNVSREADAILFMSLLNSEDPYFIIGQQALVSYTILQANLEHISTGYLIIEPGATAGWIGKAKLLPRNSPKLTAAYSLAAEMLGFKIIYLEAGSGSESIPKNIIKLCSQFLKIPIMVGGGVESKEEAKAFVQAGADIIVMGSYLENHILRDDGESLKAVIDGIKEAGKKSKKNFDCK